MNFTLISFISAFAALILSLLMRKINLRTAAVKSVVAVSTAGLAAEIIRRSVVIGFPAITSSYEALLFLILSLMISVLVMRDGESMRLLRSGLLLMSLLLMITASSPLFPDEPKPPVPALRSCWLVLHVSFAFAGEGLFAAAFVSSLLGVLHRDSRRRMDFEKITYYSILAGYPLYTLGALIFGAIWAASAWGRFWSWDPKETWALITWLTYTYYLHIRLRAGKSTTVTRIVSICGFVFTLVTFLGLKLVSAWSDSLHLY